MNIINTMRNKPLYLLLILLLPALLCAQNRDVQIGVLAKRGEKITLEKWSATADYLNEKIEGYDFSIIPVPFDEMDETIRMKKVDFILTNTASYVDLASRYDVSRIVTMKNDILGESFTYFGGVLFTRADRIDLNSITDLKQKELAAVDRSSLGGWIALWREMAARNITPDTYFDQIGFLASHDEVVYAVRDGLYDAGTVRTDTLERMASEGRISLNDYKLVFLEDLNRSFRDQDFPYLLSTRLYPEWPLSKLAHTPNHLAERVATELISLPAESKAAQAASIRGWTIPLNYQTVHDSFFELKIGPYQSSESIKFFDVLSQYLLWIILICLTIFFLISIVLYILTLNRKLKISEETMRKMATHDPLTQLPNRRYFQEFAEKTLELCRRRGCRMAIYYLDLDYFKPVNDTYGHEAGDLLLQEVGRRLIKQMRKSDLCARIGGDEFVALIQDVEQDDGFDKVARRLLNELSHPYFIMETEIIIGVSIGISFFPEQGGDLEELLKKADQALYEAKDQGKGRYRIYRGD
ncbi:MAG: diguanylate cyclase [Spirochaetales bacterium]|nr:diguanylate cyclase [Spirochaetales bacterium]